MLAAKTSRTAIDSTQGHAGPRVQPPPSPVTRIPSAGSRQPGWSFGNTPVFPGKSQRVENPPRAAERSDSRTGATIGAAAVNDPLEREASRIAGQALESGRSHPLLEQGLSHARMHTGREAEASALDAAAFTIGSDIVFAAGQYRPDTRPGQWLIAHEAVHVAQQMHLGQPMVQRQAANTVVQMPPQKITGALNPVEQSVPHLDELRNAGVTSSTVGVAHSQADVDRNSPDPAAVLPFTPSGWDGNEILQKLGQYDRMPGTDSDSLRCVQAVGMAAHVPDGPQAVSSYLSSLVLQGMLGSQMTARTKTAIDVLNHVKARIESKRATYGDLAWAQEAMHDLFYNDVSGTPLTDIPGQVNPALDLTKNLQTMDVWCDTPQQVMAEASKLKPGEQLLIEEWTVSLNTTFDQLDDQHIAVGEGQSITVNINGRHVPIRKIATGQRPPHTALDFNRDTRMGHQLLIVKDSASGALKLYEPEITQSGRHFDGLAADGSNLTEYFKDQPNFGMYCYIEIIGKLQPGLASPSAPSAAHP
jgi:hypothetical protein